MSQVYLLTGVMVVSLKFLTLRKFIVDVTEDLLFHESRLIKVFHINVIWVL